MIDWSKYPRIAELLDDELLSRSEDLEFKRLIQDVRRAERKRCAEACPENTCAIECREAIEALEDD